MPSLHSLLSLLFLASAVSAEGGSPSGDSSSSPTEAETAKNNDGRLGSSYRELLREEPNWASLGNPVKATDRAIGANGATQVWGSITPATPTTDAQPPLCKWDDGKCKTDISWLLSSVGIYKELFDDDVANYYMRFHIFGLCYRFTKYQNDNGAATCGDWIWEQGKNSKIAASEVCFDLKRKNETTGEYDYLACAHQAPWTASRKMARRLQQHLDTNMLGQRHLLQSVYGYQDRNDFVSPARLYDDDGKDTDATWGGFFECRDVNQENKGKTPAEREQCWDERTGFIFDVDVPALRQVLQMIQNETRGEDRGGQNSPWGGAMCNAQMEVQMESGDPISSTSTAAEKKAYCEGTLNDFIINDRLNGLLNFNATLEEKKSLKRVDDGQSFGSLSALRQGASDNGAVATGATRALLAISGIVLALLAA